MNLGNSGLILLSFLLISLSAGLNGNENEKSPLGKGKQEVSKILTKLAFLDEIRSSELFPNSNANEHPSQTVNLLEKAFNGETTLSSFKRLCTGYKDLAASANNARLYLRNAALIDEFLDNVFETEVFRTALDYLSSNGLLSASDARSTIKKMWFSDNSAFRKSFCMLPTSEPEQKISQNWGGNWLGFYLQNNHIPINEKKTSQDEQNEATDQRRFLIGKTPEFELAAFTLCALAQPHHPSKNGVSNVVTTKRCRFVIDKQNNEVDTVVSSVSAANQNIRVLDIAWEFPGNSPSSIIDNSEYARHLSNDFPSILDSADEDPKHKKKKKHNNTGTNDPQLQGLVSQMWKLDEVDRVNNDSILFNYGNHTDGVKDVSTNAFVTCLNESFLEKPLYAALVNIYNASLFHQPVCTAEDSMNDTRRAALENFLNVVTNTSVFQTAYDFLKARNKTGASYDEFYNKLFNLWFGTYSRCHGALGSSGWEHVFSGEYKGETVDGHHSWIRYYLGEKAGEIDYHGYYSYVDGILATIQYTWKGYMKKIGGFLLRSSPAFDFSLFTVCSLTHTGEQKCKFKIQGNDLFVTSFTQKCDAGYCLSTSFPGMKS